MSLISNVHLGNWEYYIFSDNTAIWRATNGLASWFNGSGGMIQGAAWLGALIMLAMILFGAAVRKQVTSTGTIGAWFFFMSTMGITGQAVITNIYTGQVTVVNNVPALALVPASVFSKAAYNVFLSMETAFQGVNGSYMSVSQNGFAGPLEVLLAMRSNKIAVMRPDLIQNLTYVLRDCTTNDKKPPAGAGSLNDAKDALAFLAQYGRASGFTQQFTFDDIYEGSIVGCSEAWSTVNSAFEAYAQDNSSSGITKLINSETTKRNPMNSGGFWSASDIDNAHNALLNVASGVSQSAIEFTKNALSASTVTYMRECMYSTGLMTSQNVCNAVGLVEGDQLEKWKTAAAMSASGFMKTMFTSMGVLQAMFFALFPVIVIYGLVLPSQTGKVFGGYIFFGVWCQSWMLVVAPLQSYLQTSVVDEITKIVTGSQGVTYANMMSVYTSLSTKLAVASDLMASAQMLSLALLSGSMYALNGIAEKWSGSQQVDTSKLQLDSVKSGAMLEIESIGKAAPILHNDGSVSIHRQYQGGQAYQFETSSKNEESSMYAKSSGRGYAHDRANVQSSGSQDEKDRAYQTERKINEALTNQISADLGISKDKAGEIVKSASSLIEANGQVTTDVAKALGVGFRDLFKSKGANLSAAQGKELDSQIAAQTAPGLQAAANQLAAKDANFFQKLYGTAGSEAQSQALGTLIDTAAPIIGAGITIAGTASTLGAGAPAAAMAGVGATTALQVAKPMLLQKLKEAGTNVAAGLADSSRAGNFASALGGGVQAAYKAATSTSFDEKEKEGTGLSSKISDTKTGTHADSSSKAWTNSTKHKDLDSNIDSLTKKWSDTANEEWKKGMTESRGDGFKTTIDTKTLMRWAVDGKGGVGGTQMRENADNTAALLKLSDKYKAEQKTDAWTKAGDLQNNAPEGSYKNNRLGEDELKRYEKNVLFERILTGRNDGALSQKAVQLAPAPSAVQPISGPAQSPATTQAPAQVEAVQQPVGQPAAPSLGSQIPAMPSSLASASDQLNARPSDKLKDVSSAMPVKPAEITFEGAKKVVEDKKVANDKYVRDNNVASLKDSKLAAENAEHESKANTIIGTAAGVSFVAKGVGELLNSDDDKNKQQKGGSKDGQAGQKSTDPSTNTDPKSGSNGGGRSRGRRSSKK